MFNKKYLNIYLAISSFLFITACVSRNAQLLIVKQHYDQGEKYLSEGKLDLSESEFKAASAILPDHAKPYFGLGKLYSKKGRTDDALTQFEKALALYPFDPELNYNIAILLDKKGDIQGSVTKYKLAFMSMPENDKTLLKDIRIGLGVGYFKLSNYDVAMDQFKKGLEIDPLMSIPHYYIGKIYKASNSLNIAISEFEKAISLLYLLEDTEDNKSYISNLFKDYEEALQSTGIQNAEITERTKKLKKILLF